MKVEANLVKTTVSKYSECLTISDLVKEYMMLILLVIFDIFARFISFIPFYFVFAKIITDHFLKYDIKMINLIMVIKMIIIQSLVVF